MILHFIFALILGVTAQIRKGEILDRYGASSQVHNADMSMCQEILAVLRLKGMLQDVNTAARFMRGPDRGEKSMNDIHAVSQLLARMLSNRPGSGGGGSFGEGEPGGTDIDYEAHRPG